MIEMNAFKCDMCKKYYDDGKAPYKLTLKCIYLISQKTYGVKR